MSLTYQAALDYINSFTNYEIKPQYRYAPDVHDPDRPARLLALLGNPHQQYPTIHVAGTKGKGSASAICASVLRAANLRTGLYISPHLQSFTERIQVNGVQIPRPELVTLVEQLQPVVAEVEGITTFEIITALAFLYFAQQEVEVAVIEVGLGGRLDATNVIRPMVSVITTLGYDHTYLLGDTLAEIAAEKAGIIKTNVPVVSAAQQPEALAVLERIAAERSAPLTVVGREWWYEVESAGLEGQQFRAGRAGEPGSTFRLSLMGEHQALNATVALATLALVQPHLPGVDERAMAEGLVQVEWPGRFQILSRRPTVVVDGAHNIDSVRVLRRTIETLFAGKRLILVFGVTADKAVTEIVDTLFPVADEIIITTAQHPRAAPSDQLAARLAQHNYHCTPTADVAAALDLALQQAGPQDLVCITGSLFVVGDALTAWQARTVAPAAD